MSEGPDPPAPEPAAAGPAGTVLAWTAAGGWQPTEPPAAGPPDAADSWLVDARRIRGMHRHWSRFAAACAEAGVTAPGDLRTHLLTQMPATGRWFPRVELRDGRFLLHVRPAPERRPTVAAWVCDRPDPRGHPRRKGPDLALLAELRDEAASHGAEEALLADEDGGLLEGAYTSLLWWEGATLCAVPDDAPILQGVTRRLLLQLALVDGVPVRYARPTPADIAEREVWLTSALHGIRAMMVPAGAAPRAPWWQRRLEDLAQTER